jgi:hypothetical protein
MLAAHGVEIEAVAIGPALAVVVECGCDPGGCVCVRVCHGKMQCIGRASRTPPESQPLQAAPTTRIDLFA